MVALFFAIMAAPAHAAGSYTHVVCADAATGNGVDADARLPSGMTSTSGHTVGADAPTATRCRGRANSGTGVPVRVGIAYSANDLSGNGTLIYRPAPNTTIRAATLWVAGRNGPPENHTSISVHGGDPPQWVYGPPVPLFCGWFQTPCAGFGDLSNPFAASNRLEFANVPPSGFYLTLGCDAPDANYGCTFGPQEMRLFGARVVLDDTSNPIPSTVSGSLTSESRFAGPLDITLNASDTGSGVYRVLLLVDDKVAASRVVDANGGACADVNPSNSDPYEFGSQTPCKSAASGTFTFDQSGLPDGAHNLKVPDRGRRRQRGHGGQPPGHDRRRPRRGQRLERVGQRAPDRALDEDATRHHADREPTARGPQREARRPGRESDLRRHARRAHAHDGPELTRARVAQPAGHTRERLLHPADEFEGDLA